MSTPFIPTQNEINIIKFKLSWSFMPKNSHRQKQFESMVLDLDLEK